jgi:hypothetical protein
MFQVQCKSNHQVVLPDDLSIDGNFCLFHLATSVAKLHQRIVCSIQGCLNAYHRRGSNRLLARPLPVVIPHELVYSSNLSKKSGLMHLKLNRPSSSSRSSFKGLNTTPSLGTSLFNTLFPLLNSTSSSIVFGSV